MRRPRLVLVLLIAPIALSLPQVPEPGFEPAGFARPAIQDDYIPYGPERKRQMAAYSDRHYGFRTWRLKRKRVIVLHFTGGSTYASARNHFASNSPSRGEYPGVCTHFAVDKDGTIYKMVPPSVRCRHAIGLNHRALGIEMVQETGRGSHWAAQQILNRRAQIRAALRLTGFLKQRHGIRMRNVIGHAMANNSPLFRDLQGWTNDHTDWLWRDVKEFRRRLRAMS